MAGVQRQFASRAHVTQGFPLSLRVCRFAQRPPLSAKAGALAAMVCLAAMGRPAAASLSFDTCRPLSNPRHAFHVLASVAPDAQPAPNFRLFRVTGDGACMFRSIAQGAQILSRGSPMSPESETQAALNLRKAVVSELQKRRDDIEPFIPGILDGDTTFEAYLDRMSLHGAWGGEPEMVMAVHVVRMPISVWRVTPAGAELIVTYGDELKGLPPINLLWHSAGHYDLLVVDAPGAASAA